MRLRPVESALSANYLQKAAECLQGARDAIGREHGNAVVINAVHCGISAADALTVFFKGVRHAGERHEDAIALLRTLDFEQAELAQKARQLQRLLQIKNEAEYEEKLLRRKDAEAAVLDAERFLTWAKSKLATR